MALEASKNKKWDKRLTRGPKNVIVYIPNRYINATPEEVLAEWWRVRCYIPETTLRALRRCKDLVVTTRVFDPRSKSGRVELLTIDLRGKTF
jgi:hypothetical protein